jgi:EpsI family protein
MKRTLTIVILLLAAVAANYALARPEAKLSRNSLQEFPAVIGEWKLFSNHRLDEDAMEALQVDDYLMRSYANPLGQVIGLYIGYFKSQRDGKQNHSPRQCLPGAGWSIAESRTIPLKVPKRNQSVSAINFYLMRKDGRSDIYLWWYQGRGRVYASEFLNKLYLILDSVTMNRTDGALVRVNMPVSLNQAEILETQLGFLSLITPVLPEYLPD